VALATEGVVAANADYENQKVLEYIPHASMKMAKGTLPRGFVHKGMQETTASIPNRNRY